MPSKAVDALRQEIKDLKDMFDAHIKEGVNLQLAVARVQSETGWLKIIGLIILTAIAGLYFKK